MIKLSLTGDRSLAETSSNNPPARMDARSTHPRSSGLSAPWRAPLPECFQVLDIAPSRKKATSYA